MQSFVTNLHVPSQYSPDKHGSLVLQEDVDVNHFILIFKNNIMNPTFCEATDNLLTHIFTMAYATVCSLARLLCNLESGWSLEMYAGVKSKEPPMVHPRSFDSVRTSRVLARWVLPTGMQI